MALTSRNRVATIRRNQIIAATLIMVGVVGFIGMQVIHGRDTLQTIGLLWLVYVAIFTIADFLSGWVEECGGGVGYLFFIVSMAWLTLGLIPVLLLLLVGATMAAIARLRGFLLLHLPVPSVRGSFSNALKRVTIYSLPLLLMTGLADLLEQQIPFNIQHTDGFVIGFLLVVGYATTMLSRVLFAKLPPPRFRWDWELFLTDLMLLVLIVPLTYIYTENGELLFGALLIMLALQVIRRWQVARVQETLLRRVQELSMLNSIAQGVSSQLVLEDVLTKVKDWAVHQNFGIFYVALVDDVTMQISFPVVLRFNKSLTWAQKPLTEDAFIQRIMSEREPFSVSADDIAADDRSVLNDVTLASRFQGFPLRVGNKFFGVMGLVEDLRHPLEGRLTQDTVQIIANQIGLAVRNATLYGRTLRLAENLREINASVQGVMFNLDTEVAMRRACELAARIVNAQKAIIFMREQPHDKSGHLVQSCGLTDAHLAIYNDPSYPYEHHLRQTARIISNVAEVNDPEVKTLAQAGEFAAMAEIPMTSNSVMGILTVFHDVPHDYTVTEVELLGTVANQVMSAVDNAQLLVSLETYAAEQAQLVHLSRITTSNLDLTRLVLDVATLLQDILRTTWADVGLIPDEVNYLQLYRSDGETRQAIVLDDLPEIRDAVIHTSVGPHVYYVHTPSLSAETNDWMLSQGIETLIVMLLMANNQLIGLTLLGYDGVHYFSDSETRLLEMATNQVAAQLHNALQYGDTQRQLDWRLQQLSLIEGIAQQISSALSLNKLIRNLLEAAIRATSADMASLALLMDADTMQVYLLQVEEGVFRYRELERASSSGVVEQVLRTGQRMMIPDNRQQPNYVSIDHYAYLSSLVLPLMREREIIGVLNLESYYFNHFREEQLAFLNSLVGHAVVSIHNARLLQEREAQIQTLNQLRELSIRLSVETTPNAALEIIAEATLDLLQGERVLVYHFDSQSIPFAPLFTVDRDPDKVLTDLPPFDVIQKAVAIGEVIPVPGTGRMGVAIPVLHGEDVADVFFVWLDRHYRDLNSGNAGLLAIQATGHLKNVELVERIRTQNNRMEAILDSTRDGVILFDREGRIIDVNISAEALLGIDLLDYIGKSLEDLLADLAALEDKPDAPKSPLYQAFEETLRQVRISSERTISGALEVRFEDRRIRYLHRVSSPVTDSHNGFYGRLLTFRDVTEEQLLAAYRGQIASMVVHDLRGPLGAMLTSLALVEEIAVETNNAELTEVAALSVKSGQKMLELVNSLLDVARLETREMPIRRAPVDLPPLIEEARLALLSLIDKARIRFETDLPPNLPLLYIDGEKIRRVLINLLDNAVRYTPLDGNVLIRVQLVDGKARVSVADNGPGIAADQMTRIFEKFRQADDVTVNRRGGKGSGLGLAFCKLTLEAHNESIWVELPGTGPLPGACITFTLPTVADEKATFSDEDRNTRGV